MLKEVSCIFSKTSKPEKKSISRLYGLHFVLFIYLLFYKKETVQSFQCINGLTVKYELTTFRIEPEQKFEGSSTNASRSRYSLS